MIAHVGEDVGYGGHSPIAGESATSTVTMESNVAVPQEDGTRSTFKIQLSHTRTYTQRMLPLSHHRDTCSVFAATLFITAQTESSLDAHQ